MHLDLRSYFKQVGAIRVYIAKAERYDKDEFDKHFESLRRLILDV